MNSLARAFGKADFKRRMRRTVCTILTAVFLALFALPCFSAKTAPIKVAVVNYPNYLQRQKDGSINGYAYEYLLEIQKYTGWEYEFIDMSYTAASEAIINGEIDLLAGSQYTAERAQLYDFSARSMGEGGSVLCVMPEDMRYCYNDFNNYGGMRIAALEGTVRIQQTKEVLDRYGVSAKFVIFETDGESKAALEEGKVDAVLMSSIRCESKYKILARINTAPLYFCINNRRYDIKEQLDEAMELIHLNAPYYEQQLDAEYYGSVPVQLAFTQEEKDYIMSAGVISVAVSDDLLPVEYYDEETGGYKGVVLDSFKMIEEYSGLSFSYQPRGSFESLSERLASGEVQIIASVADKPGIPELWGVEITDAYYDNSVSIVINDALSDYTDLNCKVVIKEGYPYIESLVKQEGYKDITYVDSFTKCVEMVNSRKADITLIPSDCAGSIINSYSFSSVGNYLVPDTYMDYCVGVRKGENPILISILNKSIASITKAQRMELLVQNLTLANQSQTLKSFLNTNKDEALLVALAVAVLIIVFTIHFALSRQRLNKRLEAALKKADAASKAKTDFLARMSHDMRTPMNGILGLSYLIEESTDSPEIKYQLRQQRESGEYLLQLINDVLDVNKVESGKLELNPKKCDEEMLFNSIIELVKPLMEKKNITFNFGKVNIEWRYLLLDEQRVKQIFINLLNNAVKFTPEGGRIDFIMELVAEDEYTVRDKFIVRDTGIGMSKDFLSRLFEPFSQENRIEQETGGTGLGLSIAKKLVELMNGTISVKSELNKGTEFTVYIDFPIAERPQDASKLHDTYGVLPLPLRILLCEDHPLNAQIAIRLLENHGAEVVWCENGKLGAQAFKESKLYYFDAILMDIRMPELDGIEATRRIRAFDRKDAKTVPIIAMTANAYEEDIKKSSEAGMNVHLAKPVEPSLLFQTLAWQVKQSRHLSGQA